MFVKMQCKVIFAFSRYSRKYRVIIAQRNQRNVFGYRFKKVYGVTFKSKIKWKSKIKNCIFEFTVLKIPRGCSQYAVTDFNE